MQDHTIDDRIQALAGRHENCEAEVVALKREVTDLKAIVSSLEMDRMLRSQEDTNRVLQLAGLVQEDFTALATDRVGFTVVPTRYGNVLVALKASEKYLDGQKLNLLVGNPWSATFKGVSLSCQYGPRKPSGGDVDVAAWRHSLREVRAEVPNDLLAGAWTSVEVVVPTVQSAGVGFIGVRVEPSIVSLSARD